MVGPDPPQPRSNVGRMLWVVLLFWLAAAVVFTFSGGLFEYADPSATTPVWQALTVGLLVGGLVAGRRPWPKPSVRPPSRRVAPIRLIHHCARGNGAASRRSRVAPGINPAAPSNLRVARTRSRGVVFAPRVEGAILCGYFVH